ncbi:MMPL family transporter [Streptomyces sp. NPDC048350]|uniref:MMPL family transporter n=1 Tax=Streptomyces sp. NPDC048350 TaxID=3365538 RepID=UPI00370F7DC5
MRPRSSSCSRRPAARWAITPVSTFALNLAIALGSGPAVDHSVFLLSRYRDERAAGAGREAALAAARKATSPAIAYSAPAVIAPAGDRHPAATPVTD